MMTAPLITSHPTFRTTIMSHPTFDDRSTDHEPSSAHLTLDDCSTTYRPMDTITAPLPFNKQHTLIKIHLSSSLIITTISSFKPKLDHTLHPEHQAFSQQKHQPSLLTAGALSFLTARAPSLLTAGAPSKPSHSRSTQLSRSTSTKPSHSRSTIQAFSQ